MNPKLSGGAKAFLAAGARAGGVVSDGPVVDGWGVHPFKGKRAHHWQRFVSCDGDVLRAACGLRATVSERVPLLGSGTYESCVRCERALMR